MRKAYGKIPIDQVLIDYSRPLAQPQALVATLRVSRHTEEPASSRTLGQRSKDSFFSGTPLIYDLNRILQCHSV